MPTKITIQKTRMRTDRRQEENK